MYTTSCVTVTNYEQLRRSAAQTNAPRQVFLLFKRMYVRGRARTGVGTERTNGRLRPSSCCSVCGRNLWEKPRGCQCCPSAALFPQSFHSGHTHKKKKTCCEKIPPPSSTMRHHTTNTFITVVNSSVIMQRDIT